LRSRKLAPLLAALLPALSATLLVLGTARTAQALPLLTLSGSVRGLYGAPIGDSDRNPYGGGLGLRLGVTLPASLYLGGSFEYFFGKSDQVGSSTSDQVGFSPEVSSSLLQVMGRVGYDLGFGPLTLRPQLGFGLARTLVKLEDVDLESESDFVLAPGAEFVVGLGLLSVSAEASYNKVFAEGDADAVILGLGLGFSL
jgi:Outer membrane protein beta-barrel domain